MTNPAMELFEPWGLDATDGPREDQHRRILPARLLAPETLLRRRPARLRTVALRLTCIGNVLLASPLSHEKDQNSLKKSRTKVCSAENSRLRLSSTCSRNLV